MKKNYDKLAKEIVELIGEAENVVYLTHCITRLRFVLKDETIAKTTQIEQLSGVVSVIKAGGQYQVVIGNDVDDVYQAIGKIKGITLEGKVDIDEGDSANGKKGKILSNLVDIISGIFMPCMQAMVAAGLIKAIIIMLSSFGLLSVESTTYTILYAIGDGFFYFMPIFLGASAAKKFGSNLFLGMAVAAAFLYPDINALFTAGAEVGFIGIPVKLISYPSSVLPIIVAVYAMTQLEKLFKRIIPQILVGVFVPVFTLLVTVPVSLIVIGPVTDQVGTWMATGITFLMGLCPPVTGFVFGALWSVFIMFGMHWAFIPVGINNLVTLGYDTIMPMTFPCTLAQAGACLGVALKTKNKKVKEVSTSAFFSAFIGSISEPAIYGVNLKYKKPFIIASVFTGVGGAIIATAGGQMTAQFGVSLFTLPAVAMFPAGIAMLLAIAIAFVGSIIGTYLFGYSDKMLENGGEIAITMGDEMEKVVVSPVTGDVISIKEVCDETFSTEMLGKGIAVIPNEGDVYAPCDGVVKAAFPHAIGIEASNGVEILVHFGLDTVKLNGEYLDLKVKVGDAIKAGDIMIKADIDGIKSKGFDVTTVVLVTNKEKFGEIKLSEKGAINIGETIFTYISK